MPSHRPHRRICRPVISTARSSHVDEGKPEAGFAKVKSRTQNPTAAAPLDANLRRAAGPFVYFGILQNMRSTELRDVDSCEAGSSLFVGGKSSARPILKTAHDAVSSASRLWVSTIIRNIAPRSAGRHRDPRQYIRRISGITRFQSIARAFRLAWRTLSRLHLYVFEGTFFHLLITNFDTGRFWSECES